MKTAEQVLLSHLYKPEYIPDGMTIKDIGEEDMWPEAVIEAMKKYALMVLDEVLDIDNEYGSKYWTAKYKSADTEWDMSKIDELKKQINEQ